MIEIVQNMWKLFLIGAYPHGPLGGLAGTLIMAVLCLAASFPMAILLAMGRISANRLFRWPAFAVIYVMRGTPFLMVIFWAYFLVPLMLGFPVGAFTIMVVALVLYESAYLAEVIRAGIEALPKGQTEAAESLGMSRFAIMITVILPQALYNSMPGMLNQFVSIIKETSIGSVIGVQEFTFAAAQVNSILVTKPLEVFGLLAITYFCVCGTLSLAVRYFEGRIGRVRGVSLV